MNFCKTNRPTRLFRIATFNHDNTKYKIIVNPIYAHQSPATPNLHTKVRQASPKVCMINKYF